MTHIKHTIKHHFNARLITPHEVEVFSMDNDFNEGCLGSQVEVEKGFRVGIAQNANSVKMTLIEFPSTQAIPTPTAIAMTMMRWMKMNCGRKSTYFEVVKGVMRASPTTLPRRGEKD